MEGSYRGPAMGQGEQGGWFSEPVAFGFQRNLKMNEHNIRNVPAVHACVMATANAVSQCKPKHYKEVNGKVEELKESAAMKVMRKPNAFETWPQFISNAIINMKYEGEAFAIVKRNKRFEVVGLYLLPRGSVAPYLNQETNELFYSIGEDPLMFEKIDYLVPNRDILHLRQHATRHPLKGESDIAAAAMAIDINVELSRT